MVTITDAELKQAAAAGTDNFIKAFTDKYMEVSGGALNKDNLHLLTGEQHVLLSYHIFREEVLAGGFCQLIQNGYGPYIFDNPFAKAMRLWGLKDFSKQIYEAKKIYDANREDLEKERTEEEFMAMYEQYEVFDDMDEDFLEREEEITATIARYVDENVELFATIIK